MRLRPFTSVLLGVLFASVSFSAAARPSWMQAFMQEGQKNFVLAFDAFSATDAVFVAAVDSGGNTEMQAYKTADGSSFQRIMLPSASGGGMMSMVFFSAISMYSPSVYFLAGAEVNFPTTKNKLWRSTNAGASWDVVTDQLPDLPSRLVVLSDGTVLGMTPSGIFRVSGTTVTPAFVPDLGGARLMAIVMLDDLTGYAGGGSGPTDDEPGIPYGNGFVLKTSDGGANWVQVASGLPLRVETLYFINQQRGFAGGTAPGGDAGTGVLYRTDDDGATWTLQTLPLHPAFDVEITMPFKTTQHIDETPASSVLAVRFFDCSQGVASGVACIGGCDSEEPTYLSFLWYTQDAGATWIFDPDFEPAMEGGQLMPDAKKMSALLFMNFPDINHGFLAGQHVLVLRYSAQDSLPLPGPPPETCEGGNNNNNNNNNNNGNNTGSGSDDSGCGCRVGTKSPSRLPWPWMMGVIAITVGLRARRKSVPNRK